MSRRTLRQGDAGEDVRHLQEFLQREFDGGMTIPPGVTGSFDADTDAAVRAFQTHYGLDADGVVGPDTWDVIEEVDPDNWRVAAPDAAAQGPQDEHVMDMEAMDLRPFGDHSQRLPSDDDAAQGRESLKGAVFDAANHDSWWYADMYEVWDSDWDPHKAGSEMFENAVGALTAGGPLSMISNGSQAVTGFIEGLFMDGMYAEYKGRAEAHRWWFFKWVAEGVAAGLTPGGQIGESNPIQAAAAAGAWQAITSLPHDERFKIAAAAVKVGFDGLPRTHEEWGRAIDPSTSYLESGLFEILWAWGASAPRTRAKPRMEPPDPPQDVFDVADTTLGLEP